MKISTLFFGIALVSVIGSGFVPLHVMLYGTIWDWLFKIWEVFLTAGLLALSRETTTKNKL